MGALDNFLKRFGYAKLDRYGLVLTPDDRVISMRPAVLDDGIGSKIVGWQEGDLAAMELERWGAAKVAAAKPIAAPKSLHQLPPKTATAAKVIAPAAPVAVAAPAAARPLPGVAPIAVPKPTAPAPVVAPVVAAAVEPGEDEWEWEIAMARARAAAEEVEEARMDLVGASAVVVSAVIKRKTNPGITAVSPPPRSFPKPEPLPDFPKTEPFNEAWHDKSEISPQVLSPLQKDLAVAKTTKTPPRGSVAVPAQRSTVIPVPQLPTASDPRQVRPPVTPPRRLARGTGSPQTREETVKTHAVRAANDDKTSPYIELPSEVKPSGFAHTKRVAARQK